MTGDYVVGGVGLRGTGVNGVATGTITIPDPNAYATGVPPQSVPAGADIVAALLYWETVEKDKSTFAGQNGSFNGYAISGTVLGNNTAPTTWSPGGCTGNTGNSNGVTTIRAYRADVRPYLPVDANGNIQANGSFQVKLADSGSNGNGTPFTLGATLVIIYRVLSPPVPLNAIVIYDGAAAPSNSVPTITQPIVGFYQAGTPLGAASPVAKITHIVGNGQQTKSETVTLQTVLQNGSSGTIVNLPSIYGTGSPPFPGKYNGSWDNATWVVNNYAPINTAVLANAASVTTSVAPTPQNGNCVDWGAIIFSTTVQDTDGDGLLDVWEDNHGYIDAKQLPSGQWVALPGANKFVKDIFVEIDYLSNLDGLAGAPLHSHLPKRAALDMVGNAFLAQNINVHFDLGPGIYQDDPFVVTYPVVPAPPAGVPTFSGAGGNAISESAVLCTDQVINGVPTLCQFPSTPSSTPPIFVPAVAWKGGFQFVRDNNATVPNSNPPLPLLGNFQPGRGPSYRYVLFGHALGEPRSSWSTQGNVLSDPGFPRLVSIVNSGTTATVTLHSPPGILKPGDCPNTSFPPGCGDANVLRVTVGGAIGQPALNGTYIFSNAISQPDPNNSNVIITTFNITTNNPTATCTTPPCVANGTYSLNNEPQLGVAYAGPTSTSGHSDFRGGADSAVTFGLWGADDAPGCQPDPSVPAQTYCNNEVGSALKQGGTLMHEVGHTLTLTHGGTYYRDLQNPSVPTYELNCKPNFLSVMSYLFQVRGFPDVLPDGTHPIDYSGQTLATLSESTLNVQPGLNEMLGIGSGAAHLTRWYAPPNAFDTQQQNSTGGRFATFHCDGTPLNRDALGNVIEPPAVRLDGSNPPAPMIDWNNNLIVPDLTEPVAWQDVNYNGSTASSQDLPFSGFNDWQAVNLLQIGARAGALGLSGSGGTTPQFGGGSGAPPQFGGGSGTTPQFGGGSGAPPQFGGGSGTPPQFGGGSGEQDEDTACSTADPPTGLSATVVSKSVVLNWTRPEEACQVRRFDVWRAVGSFPTLASVRAAIAANPKLFTDIGHNVPPPTPPSTTFTDSNVKNNTTYTYFVTDTNKQGAQSDKSAPVTILVKFSF